jgi:peptidoglycan/xylan/chitin deacetylase (PgdA/CDA1 family)
VPLIALEYHDVVRGDAWDESGFPGASAATYKLPADRFAAHLDALNRAGAAVGTATVGSSPAPDVLLTFDDGGAGYLAHAADLLERHGWRGFVFMTTGRIGQPGFLRAGELRELRDRGHVIGSHSRNHPARMSALAPDDIDAEWRTSLSDLEDVLGGPVSVASVPGGYHSRLVAELAAKNGITTLFTSEPEVGAKDVDGCRVIGRFTLRTSHSAAYAARLVGASPWARTAQWAHWNAKKLAKAVGGTHYLRVRDRILGR